MSRAKETLDRVFSRYVRLRDCPDGTGRCFSCGRAIAFSACDAGHYIPRTHTATRWNPVNVHAQCRTCNRLRDGNAAAYRRNLVIRYGEAAVEELERQRHLAVRLSDEDLRALAELYRQHTDELNSGTWQNN